MAPMGDISRLTCIAVLYCLAACEAPLVLDKVEQQNAMPTQRSDLFQSAAANDSTLVAVGSRGAVLTSDDGGASWKREQLDGKPFLMAIASCPDSSFALLDAGRAIWLGDDTGSNWTRKEIPTWETVQALTCDPHGNFWVTGSFSTVLHSTDGGDSWEENSLDEDLHFTTIQFVDEINAYMTGEFGVVARSSDAGTSWQFLEPLPDEFYPQDALFIDNDNGWVVGLTGTVLSTHDAGATWTPQDTGTSVPLYNITKNGDKLYVVGGNGLALSSPLNGESGNGAWSSIQHDAPIRFYLRGVAAIGDDKLLVAGGAGALHVIQSGS